MYFLISIFYISLLGIITMILIKRSELKKGKNSLSSRIGMLLEKYLLSIHHSVVYFIKLFNRRTFVALIQYLTYHILFRVRKVYVEIKHRILLNPHGKRMIDAIRGRGEIKNHGASFYLRRISDK